MEKLQERYCEFELGDTDLEKDELFEDCVHLLGGEKFCGYSPLPGSLVVSFLKFLWNICLKHVFFYSHYLFGDIYNPQRASQAEITIYPCPLHPRICKFNVKHMANAQAIFVMGKHMHFLWQRKPRLGIRTSVFYSWSCPNWQGNPSKMSIAPIFTFKFGLLG